MEAKLTPRQRLMGSRKFWVSFSTGVPAIGAQILPFMSMFCGWSPEKQAAFTGMCNAISMILAGLGGVLTIMIGTEDAAEKVSIIPTAPPPHLTPTSLPGIPPSAGLQGLPPRKEVF